MNFCQGLHHCSVQDQRYQAQRQCPGERGICVESALLSTHGNTYLFSLQVPHLLQHSDLFTIGDRHFRWEFPPGFLNDYILLFSKLCNIPTRNHQTIAASPHFVTAPERDPVEESMDTLPAPFVPSSPSLEVRCVRH